MLSLITNMGSLVAQSNLNNANNALNISLQRLSSGLRINSGADDPAGLVISQEQMAQMSGLQAAITNTSKDTNVVQIADGGLNEINSLLLQIRGLAVDAANTGANDPNTLAADQAQIANALQTITRIATSTQFGSDQLLNGNHAATATISSNALTGGKGRYPPWPQRKRPAERTRLPSPPWPHKRRPREPRPSQRVWCWALARRKR